MKSKLFTLIILTSFFSVMIISCAANESSVTRALITCSSQPFFHSTGELYKPTGVGAACFDNFFIKFNYTIERLEEKGSVLKHLRDKGWFSDIRDWRVQEECNACSSRLLDLQDEYAACVKNGRSYQVGKIVADRTSTGTLLKLEDSFDRHSVFFDKEENKYFADHKLFENFYHPLEGTPIKPEHMFSTMALMKHVQDSVQAAKKN